jgi:hypothetical protein
MLSLHHKEPQSIANRIRYTFPPMIMAMGTLIRILTIATGTTGIRPTAIRTSGDRRSGLGSDSTGEISGTAFTTDALFIMDMDSLAVASTGAGRDLAMQRRHLAAAAEDSLVVVETSVVDSTVVVEASVVVDSTVVAAIWVVAVGKQIKLSESASSVI